MISTETRYVIRYYIFKKRRNVSIKLYLEPMKITNTQQHTLIFTLAIQGSATQSTISVTDNIYLIKPYIHHMTSLFFVRIQLFFDI